MLLLQLAAGWLSLPPRIAHCIVGTAFETEFYKRSRSPVSDAKNYHVHAKWLREVRGILLIRLKRSKSNS